MQNPSSGRGLRMCPVCSKVFNGRNWKQNLEYHMFKHSGAKPFQCPICPHSSALKFNLLKHIKTRHPLATGLSNVLGSDSNVMAAQSASSSMFSISPSNLIPFSYGSKLPVSTVSSHSLALSRMESSTTATSYSSVPNLPFRSSASVAPEAFIEDLEETLDQLAPKPF